MKVIICRVIPAWVMHEAPWRPLFCNNRIPWNATSDQSEPSIQISRAIDVLTAVSRQGPQHKHSAGHAHMWLVRTKGWRRRSVIRINGNETQRSSGNAELSVFVNARRIDVDIMRPFFLRDVDEISQHGITPSFTHVVKRIIPNCLTRWKQLEFPSLAVTRLSSASWLT